jgi:hypothetical protein
MGHEYEEIPERRRGQWRGEVWVFHQHTPRARKRHTCDACLEAIEPSTRYVTFVTKGVEGPGWETWRVHGECYLEGISMFGHNPRPAWRWQGDQ